MKNYLFISLLSFITLQAIAQDVMVTSRAEFGVKLSAGYITTAKESTMLINEAGRTSQKIEFAGATTQFSAGIWGQKKFGWLYADGQICYSTYGMNYNLLRTNSDEVNTNTLSEKFHFVDVQVMGGLTYAGFRLGVGPVAHILVDHQSDLTDVEYFSDKPRNISYGFSGAVGYDFDRISLDVRFDKAFRTIGDQLYYGTRQSKFKETPDAITFSVAYRLF